MRIIRVVPWVVGGLFVAGGAGAQPLLDVTGRVALLDGVAPDGARATLGMDLDRDGKLNSFEQVEVDVAEDGSYAISYTPDPSDVDLEFLVFVTRLLTDYQARGFDAVLEDGPLPIVLKVEREGYSTVIKRFTTISQAPTLDAILAPLSGIGCADGRCAASDGAVELQGFPGGTGIARAYASAYDPAKHTRYFPGSFTDTRSNLLISSGFTEINLHDESGDKITNVSSPISVRFRADENSWANLRDLRADSGRIEVPMYSFDEVRADWVTEPDGTLEAADGSLIPEADFASIQDGSYPDPVYIAFETRHFSTFNCDAPVNRRGCVKGCLYAEGQALGNIQVTASGITYTGSAGAVITGSDGCFATDLMKSELDDEDVDSNGKRGETFQAQLTANAAVGVFIGAPFDTPTAQASVRVSASGSATCLPADCDCLDLGDIEVTFEQPRACTITVNVTHSGESIIGSGGPLSAGDPLPIGTTLQGQLIGALGGPADASVCEGEPCGYGTLDAEGSATITVPVIGDEPRVELRARFSTSVGGTFHHYEGTRTVVGCARGDDTVTVDVETTHTSLGDLGAFIGSLGAGPPGSGGSGSGGSGPFGGTFNSEDNADPLGGPGCGCRVTPASSPTSSAAALLGVLALAFAHGARRSRKRAR